LFADVTKMLDINYLHNDRDYIDFNVQKLLPHKFSQYGPAMAVGDVNADGLDDLFVSGSYGYSAKFLLQQKDGRFVSRDLIANADMNTKKTEDAGALLLDADGDKDLDLYLASGGFESQNGSSNYRDQFFVNDGKGNFALDTNVIPQSAISKSCVKAADYDKDGDLDLFVGGRVVQGKYPMPQTSFVLRNDSKKGIAKFTDVTKDIAPALTNVGLTCDMLWTDVDNDGWVDMMLAGEWMPIIILKNNKGKFENNTATSGLNEMTGWWNSLVSGDFDNDGDMDYIAGNMGLNSFYKASPKYPAKMYAFDYNDDGGYDAIPTVYLPYVDGTMKEFPAFGRDDMIKQMIGFKARFTNYKAFARSPIQNILTEEEINKSLKLQVTCFASSYIQNNGDGHFEMKPLPVAAQLSAVFGMLATDVDADGNLDLLINGNDYGTEIFTGRYDAFNGLMLKGDGKGNFTTMQAAQSGFYVPGDGKSLVCLKTATAQPLFFASQNQGALLAFSKNETTQLIDLQPNDISIEYTHSNGTKRKEEVYYGHSFYSQSGRYACMYANIKSITITNALGVKRSINL
jgi:FG-GAP-like repeat